MKNKFLKAVASVFLCCAVLVSSFVQTSFNVYAACEVGIYILKFLGEFLASKALDKFLENASYNLENQEEYRIAVLTALRDFCIEYDIDPNSDEFEEFICDMMVESPLHEEMVVKYGENWGELHGEIYGYLGPLLIFYQMNWTDVIQWICDNMDNASYQISNDGNIQMPASDFKEAVEKANTQYTPKNTVGKVSFRTDTRFHNYYDNQTGTNYYEYLDLYSTSEKGFFSVGGGDEMYSMFFYRNEDGTFYSWYQFKFVVTTTDVYYEDRDEVEKTLYTYDVKYWDMFEQSEDEALTINLFTDIEQHYVEFWVLNLNRFGAYAYSNYLDYVNHARSKAKLTVISNFANWNSLVNSNSVLSSIRLSDEVCEHFYGTVTSHDERCSNNCDMGYISSSSPISLTYGLDTSKIPDNYYITTSGDTIYNYTITNPDTGESDTIYNYVTNNYTYITNNDGSGGSGSLGGNITVDGRVDVCGQVDVNVDVNGGTGTDIGDYINADGADVDVVGVLGKLPTLGNGFIEYLQGFISWLPSELYGLVLLVIIIGVFNAFRARR